MPDSLDLTSLDISPSGGGVGAFVNGIDLRRIGAEEAAAIRLALGRHGVLFFRDQALDPDAQIGFARKIGEININRFFKPTDTHPEVATVLKEPDQKNNIGGAWHTDHSYDVEPALGFILVAVETPPHVAKPEHTFRFRWRPGSVAFWDNRATWHYALNDYHGHRRLMHRITLEGEALDRAPDGGRMGRRTRRRQRKAFCAATGPLRSTAAGQGQFVLGGNPY